MKRQHETFALQIATHGDRLKAHREAYPNEMTDEVRSSAASRLMTRKDIQEAIVNLKKRLVEKAETEAVEEIKAEKKYYFLTMSHRRHILAQIAAGRKFPVYDKNGKKTWRTPTDADRIKAIELDMEITGEGWRPPQPETPGEGKAAPVYNTVIRKTVFKTNVTTSKPQTFQNAPE